MNVTSVSTEDDDVVLVDAPADIITLDEDQIISENEKDSIFARLLKNNTLMTKIVQVCLNMENNSGMSRVVNKTLIPLYAATDNKFKESSQFTELLKKILENLKYDPNFKFLHIKTLCEELKSAKYRRKVPFVTIFTGKNKRSRLRKRHHSKKANKTDIIDLDNSDDEPVIILDLDEDKTRNVCEDLDNGKGIGNDNNSGNFDNCSNDIDSGNDIGSCNEDNSGSKNDCVNNDNNNDEVVTNDDAMVVVETAKSDIGSDQYNKENNGKDIECNEKTDSSECGGLNVANNNTAVKLNCEESQNHTITNSMNNKHDYCDTEHLILRNNNEIANTSLFSEKTILLAGSSNTEQLVQESNNTFESEHLVSRVSNRLPTIFNTEPLLPKSNNLSKTSSLLVPINAVEPSQHSREYKRILAIETQIAEYQQMILQLEEQEVTTNCLSSPYVLCDRYKAKIVQLYKKLCKLTGHGEGGLLKQRVVRLQVVEGHPSGPVQRLERYLNSTIDETGSAPLPDLHDVIECVTQSNIEDRLGWDTQQIMKEAIALFTNCGQAMRKSRQRREYKDLLAVLRDKHHDICDPADSDPQLRAKLEINKAIAKKNEDEIIDSFVKLAYTPKTSQTINPSLVNTSIINTSRCSDTETDSEFDLTPTKKSKTDFIQNCDNVQESTKGSNTIIEVNVVANNTSYSKVLQIRKLPQTTEATQKRLENKSTNNLVKRAITSISETGESPTIQSSMNTPHSVYSTGISHVNTINQNMLSLTTLSPTYTTAQNNINTPTLNIVLPHNINTSTQNIMSPQIINTPVNKIMLPQNTCTSTQNIIFPQNIILPQNMNTSTQNITLPQNINKSIQNIIFPQNINTSTKNIILPQNMNTTHNIMLPQSMNMANQNIMLPQSSPQHIILAQNINTGTQNFIFPQNVNTSTQNIVLPQNANAPIRKTTYPQNINTSTQNITFEQNINKPTLNIILPQNTTSTVTQNFKVPQNVSHASTQNIINIVPQNISDSLKEPVTNKFMKNNTNTPTQNISDKNSKNVSQEIVNSYVSNVSTHLKWSNTVQKIGNSNRYAVAFESTASEDNDKIDDLKLTETNLDKSSKNIEVKTNDIDRQESNSENLEVKIEPNKQESNTESKTDIDRVQDQTEKDIIQENLNGKNLQVEIEQESNSEQIVVKTEDTNKEPIDVNTLLNALGDNYISTVFDIEDPFLVVDISSDSSEEDD